MSSPTLHIFQRRSEANLTAARQEKLPAVEAMTGQGWDVDCNLFTTVGPLAHQIGSRITNRLDRRGAMGGDLASVLSCLTKAKKASVIWSTVDTTGIPLARVKAAGLLRNPLVYTSIGLPERLDRITHDRDRQRLLKALGTCDRFLCYGWEEMERLRSFFPHKKDLVHFLPYFADTDTWLPLERPETCDVLSVGMDTHRDFAVLREYAETYPQRTVRIIGPKDLAEQLAPLPSNLSCNPPVPLEEIPEAFASARVIALPVKDNTYSGATTTLLQAMSMARPVVVSTTGAIREGYGLREAKVCCLAPPSDSDAFAMKIERLLDSPSLRNEMGRSAREHVASTLSRQHWAETMDRHLREASGCSKPVS